MPKTEEEYKEYYKNYSKKNKEKIALRQKKWAENNQERLKKHRQEYYLKNKETINTRRSARFHEDKAKRPEFYMWLGARDRSKIRGHEFNLEPEDIVFPEKCPILGIPLKVNKGKLGLDSPVLDRIDNSKGYTKDNVHVISSQANRIKGDATFNQMILLGDWARKMLDVS